MSSPERRDEDASDERARTSVRRTIASSSYVAEAREQRVWATKSTFTNLLAPGSAWSRSDLHQYMTLSLVCA